MPAELLLLSVCRAEVLAVHPRVAAGDSAALPYFRDLWADYADRPLACFLRDAECVSPPFTMLMPERHAGAEALAAPLCADCTALPPMVRLNRAVVLLKRMLPGWHMRLGG
jgi:hypothetical protein